ncbi:MULTISPECIES: immune inhibitor A domain-containing protein [unclassified Pseudoalteromonas]|uniref:immune inhibitor A domain-containing protein n=1 Tax=unclassified Pseudoalteromonas TaxID=194690 RepID=UPI0030147FFD
MQLSPTIIFWLSILFSSVTVAQTVNPERIIYWHEKQLGRSVSDYEREQILKRYVADLTPKAAIRPPFVVKAQATITNRWQQQTINSSATVLNQARVLAILVDFSDLPHDDNQLQPSDTDMYYPSYPSSHYNNLLFSDTGYSGPNGEVLQTATQYYQAASGGSLQLTGAVIGWIRADQNAAYYGKREGETRDLRAEELVFEAISKAVANNDIDLASFDNTDLHDLDGDGNRFEPDGVIDHVMLFHSSIGEEAGGGVLGTDAIWSHRFFVFNNSNQPRDIPGSDYKVFNYTINPIDAAIGVVVHEFGHELGLPDEYDLNDNTIGEPVALWSVMSSGSYVGALSGDKPSQFSAKNLEYLQQQYGGNWLNQRTFTLPELSAGQTLTLSDSSVNNGQVNQVKIALPPLLEEFVPPLAGDYHYYSGQGDGLNNQASFVVRLPDSDELTLSMLANYSIELNYDFFQVLVNGEAIAGNTTSSSHPIYPSIKHYMDGESAVFGANPVTLEFDLSSYRTQEVTVTLRYQTDAIDTLKGVLVDNLQISTATEVIYSNTAEPGFNLNYAGFRKLASYRAMAPHAYYAQLRSHRGLDAGLALASYNTGVLAWYSNDNVDNNSTSLHPGSGDLLVVDVDQQPIYKADGTSPASSIIQVRDAAMRLAQQRPGLGDQDLAAISLFDDRENYQFAIQPESGVKLPAFGAAIELTAITEDASAAEILLSYQSSPSINSEINQSIVDFSTSGLLLNESDQFLWRFGDGNSSDRLTTTHNYQSPGVYDVTFTQTDQLGNAETLATQVTITDVVQTPLSLSDLTVTQSGQSVLFSIAVSGGSTPYQIEWQFGEGNNATGAVVEHTYSLSGDYQVEVTVSDDDNQSRSQTTTVSIEVPITLEASATTNNLSATFMAAATGGDGNYQASWDFGDGQQGQGLSTSHSYATAGTYNVVLSLSDGLGQTVTGSVEITVTAAPTTPPPTDEQGESTGSSGGSMSFVIALSALVGFIRRRYK